MLGLLSDLPRKNCWTIAEWAGEVYGGNPKLRTALEERGTGYVLAVACSHEVTTGAGKFRADALAKKVPKRPGRSCPQGPAPRATASTTGSSSTSSTPGPVVASCSSAVTAAPANSPTTAATRPHRCRYPSWSRWVTLAILAHAFLAVVRADERDRHPAPDALIPLTWAADAPRLTARVAGGQAGLPLNRR